MIEFLKRRRRLLEMLAVVVVGALAFLALRDLLEHVRARDVLTALHALRAWHIAAALGFTATSYFLLTLYDVLALRVIRQRLPYRTAAAASLTSYTLSHNLGFSVLTGGSARYRIYTAAGLDSADILRVMALAAVTFWSGVLAMAGAALVFHPAGLQFGWLTVSLVAERWIGVAMLVALAVAGWLICGPGDRSNQSDQGHQTASGGRIAVGKLSLPRPTLRQAAAQPVLAALDLIAASAALFVLVPGASVHQFPAFFLGYALALIAAQVTHVPGGLGVFEAVMVAALPGIDHATLLTALILYRAIYFLLPLMVGVTVLALHEQRHRGAAGKSGPEQPIIAPPEIDAEIDARPREKGISGIETSIPERGPALHSALSAARDRARHEEVTPDP